MAMGEDSSFRFLAENSADIICRISMDHIMLYASPSLTRVLGWAPEEIVGKGPEALVIAEDLPVIAAAGARNLSPGVENSSATVRMRKKDGAIAWIEISARVVRDPVTQLPIELVLVMRDITERKRLEEELTALALTDSLMRLPNRRAFDQTLEREWKRTLREGTCVSLLMLDMDHFKEFNDSYGHMMGDDCLRAVAAVITRALRGSDFAARYGGEEIAIVLPSTSAEGALQVADKILDAIKILNIPHIRNREGEGKVTASVGVATALARDGGTTRMPEGLLAAADSALYRAKRDGRNRSRSTLLMAPKGTQPSTE